ASAIRRRCAALRLSGRPASLSRPAFSAGRGRPRSVPWRARCLPRGTCGIRSCRARRARRSSRAASARARAAPRRCASARRGSANSPSAIRARACRAPIRPWSRRSPSCSGSFAMITAVQLNLPLQVGSRLENYRILRVLAAGGFSFVYLAHDENDAPVVIKEYLPATLPLRANGQTAHLSDIERGRFNAGLKCFFEEGRSLAHLAHPNVVRVLNFFRANETVY